MPAPVLPCGRYALITPVNDLQRLFGFVELPNLPPSYNVAPTQAAPVVRRCKEGEGRELAVLRWGLVATLVRGSGHGLQHHQRARAETVAVKPAFRHAFRWRRCLVPADGFYEWQKRDGRKQPHFIRLRSGEPMAFAGLRGRWTSHDGQEGIESFTSVVTDANELLRPIHDRMPVIVAPDDYDRWLDPDGGGRARAAQALPARVAGGIPGEHAGEQSVEQRQQFARPDAGATASLAATRRRRACRTKGAAGPDRDRQADGAPGGRGDCSVPCMTRSTPR